MEKARPKTLSLFPPWKTENWVQVDDSIRGGSSVSHLAEYGSELEKGVIFGGVVDTRALGGAGFASQKYSYVRSTGGTLDLSGFMGLHIVIDGSHLSHPKLPQEKESETHQKHTFTLTLVTTPAVKLPSGRIASRVVWESDFSIPPHNSSDNVQIYLPFRSFIPNYRGRPIEEVGSSQQGGLLGGWSGAGGALHLTLDTASIQEVGIMFRSHFAQQDGPFELVIRSIEAADISESGRLASLNQRIRGLWWVMLVPLLYIFQLVDTRSLPSLTRDW